MSEETMGIVRYFARLRMAMLVLWCYLAWYVAMATLYFDRSPVLWISSAGISVFIGIALNLATVQAGSPRNRWIVFRLFLIPFCVSSYSALIKGKGFILLFPPEWRQVFVGFVACLGVIVLHWLCRVFLLVIHPQMK